MMSGDVPRHTKEVSRKNVQFFLAILSFVLHFRASSTNKELENWNGKYYPSSTTYKQVVPNIKKTVLVTDGEISE